MELVYIKNDIERDERGKIICHHNPECRCDRKECGRCGWNPTVAQARSEKLLHKLEGIHGREAL